MNHTNIPIIVVTYNREKSLIRLLASLERAVYDNEDVELIISVDKSNNEKIYRIADDFCWSHGKKKVIKHEFNLGLRKHIIKCGNLTSSYDAIIILEDDLIVSKSFYRYAIQSYDFYKYDENIAGISLYSYRVNEFSELRPFIPLQDDSDVYFAMVPSSWGQMWTKSQWISFKSWYDNENLDLEHYRGLVPDEVLNWKDTSWKKYYHVYLADMNKYFVYPRVALSTNMGDKGTNNIMDSSSHQAVLMGTFKRYFEFKKLSDESSIKYDAFFESVNIVQALKNFDQNVTVDYYGTKEKYIRSGYLMSVEKHNYQVISSWGIELVPYELNVEYEIDGERLFLYDLSKPYKFEKKFRTNQLVKYENPSLTKKRALIFCINEYLNSILRKLKL